MPIALRLHYGHYRGNGTLFLRKFQMELRAFFPHYLLYANTNVTAFQKSN